MTNKEIYVVNVFAMGKAEGLAVFLINRIIQGISLSSYQGDIIKELRH